ncbi:Diguanylate cyclase [Gammaproteobacteria bacterium]
MRRFINHNYHNRQQGIAGGLCQTVILGTLLRVPYLRNILWLAFTVVLAFPLYEHFIAYPRFEDLLIHFVEDEARRVTKHLSAPLRALPGGIAIATLPGDFDRQAREVMADFHLEELQIFAADGTVIYSSDAEDIGKVNDHDYFRQLVTQGQVFSKVLRKSGTSMEGRILNADVVEVYIPIMRDGRFLGACEIYFDITANRATLDRLLTSSSRNLLVMGMTLLGVLLVGLGQAAVAVRGREQAEMDLRTSEARFHNMAKSAQDAIIEMDSQGRIAFWNRSAERIFGFSMEQAQGQVLHDMIVPERFRGAFAANFPQFLTCGEGTIVGNTSELVGCRADGREFPVEVSIAAVAGQSGWHALGILRDISERKEAEQHLKLGSSIIHHAAQGIIITDTQLRIQMVNPAFTRLTGYATEEAIGKNPRFLQSKRHDTAFYQTLWKQLLENGDWQGEIWNRRKNGEVYAEWLSLSAIRDTHGNVTHYVGMFSDISRLKEAEEDLERLAFYDALTGIPNRILFRDRLNQAIKDNSRHDGNHKTAMFYLDLDWFKQVNDTHGHAVGDLLLQEVARRLTALVRDMDTVARIGGDEFAMVIKYIPDESVAGDIAAKIVVAIKEPFILRGITCHVGTSIGIALYPDDADNPETLVKIADTAMYEAKKYGRNGYRFSRLQRHE